jgi:hypothetical protein
MCLRGFERHRRCAGALALAGIAFYAVLLPWHTVSQAAIAIGSTSLAGLSEPPCHRSTVERANRNTKTPEPLGPRTHCPICTGLGVLHFAMASAAITLTPPHERLVVIFDGTEDHLIEALVQAAQSRGPPPHSD